ncbi:MAG: GNAT family N-acetyltransferase [Bacteroides sp.]|nr:GNAT family N-acetyltransferase [Bacteroides sp.]
MEYTIKLYTEEYFEQCADIERYLWEEDFEGRKMRFDWTYHKNPNYNKCLSVIAVTLSNEVVGFRGIFLNKFIIGGKSEVVAQICDTVIVPSTRKQGLFSKMNRFSIDALRKEGIKLILDTGPSWTPYYGNKKIGFVDLMPLRHMCDFSWGRILRERLFVPQENSHNTSNIEIVKNGIKYKIADSLSDEEIQSICALDRSDLIHSSVDPDNLKWRMIRTNKFYRFVQAFDANGVLLSFLMLSSTDLKDFNLGLVLYSDENYVKESYRFFRKYCNRQRYLFGNQSVIRMKRRS